MQTTLPDTPPFQAAAAIAKRFASGAFHCRIVGGAVRDLALGRSPEDIDLLTDATPEETRELFPDAENIGAAFGVQLIECNGVVFEVATAREERCYLDGRHPENVRYTRDFEVDAARRDFTVNAMSYDFATERIFDYFDGLGDLRRGLVRTVGDAERRFTEDYLRMLRCIRFAARYGFDIESKTFAAIRTLAHFCNRLASERVREELERMFVSRHPAAALELLSESGLLSVLLPEIERLKGVRQNPVFHPEGDVYEHTRLMLEHMAFPSSSLAWSVLFHDLGKFTCRSEDERGIHFYCHEQESEVIARRIMERFRFSAAATEQIAFAVAEHMRFAQVAQMKTAKLRRMIGHPDFALHLELNRLDCIGCHGLLDAFVRLLDEVAAMNGETRLPEPLVRGRDLIAAGLPPSPRFKELLDTLFERQLTGEFSTQEAAFDAMRDLIKRSL